MTTMCVAMPCSQHLMVESKTKRLFTKRGKNSHLLHSLIRNPGYATGCYEDGLIIHKFLPLGLLFGFIFFTFCIFCSSILTAVLNDNFLGIIWSIINANLNGNKNNMKMDKVY